MPPKAKLLKMHCRCKGPNPCAGASCTNPHVVLQPLMADPSNQRKFRFTALPASAALYNKPDFSDIKLHVADEQFYAHRAILCMASDVFARMLGPDWAESGRNELHLCEAPECIKVFDRFLYFIYSGNIIISETYVMPLFLLADKYNVTNLYEECIKVIENGLKVYVVHCKGDSDVGLIASTPVPHASTSASTAASCSLVIPTDAHMSSSSDSDSDSSDFSDSSEDTVTALGAPQTASRMRSVVSAAKPKAEISVATARLVPSETFPLSTVLRMYRLCTNERVNSAALYNLAARMGCQICQGNYAAWNDLEVDIVATVLADDRFCYTEWLVFIAAKTWLIANNANLGVDVKSATTSLLTAVRYPLMTASELYRADRDEMVRCCPDAMALVNEAIRYQLFAQCCRDNDRERQWSGAQFRRRSAPQH